MLKEEETISMDMPKELWETTLRAQGHALASIEVWIKEHRKSAHAENVSPEANEHYRSALVEKANLEFMQTDIKLRLAIWEKFQERLRDERPA